MKKVVIDSIEIGEGAPPFIVAELSGNHQHSLERCLNLVEAAKEAGVHAVKLQTFTADTITLDVRSEEFLIRDEQSLWKGRTLYDLYKEAHLPWEWHKKIFERCKELGLIAFSSPFDETAVDFLEGLAVPCYKVASPEIVDLPLIKKIASLNKPIILSSGASTLGEIQEAIATIKAEGCKKIILLKCTASYPAAPGDCNLLTIPDLAEKFGLPIGFSDHTLGIGVSIASVALGACYIEKHLTLSRQDSAIDSPFSMEPQELKQLVKETRAAWESLGHVRYGCLPSEKVTYSHRPSLYFVNDLAQGKVVGPDDIKSVRPSKGLPPKDLERVVGLTLKKSVKKGTPVSWELFDAN